MSATAAPVSAFVEDLVRLVGGADYRLARLGAGSATEGAAMFCDLTDSQLALRGELRRYFSGLLSPGERTALLTERHGTVYRDVVRRMGRDGWLGVGWPAGYGGRGFGPVEQQIFVSEAAARGRAAAAVTLQTVGPVLLAHGTAAQRDFFLPGSWPARCISPSATPSRRRAPTWRRCAPGPC